MWQSEGAWRREEPNRSAFDPRSAAVAGSVTCNLIGYLVNDLDLRTVKCRMGGKNCAKSAIMFSLPNII